MICRRFAFLILGKEVVERIKREHRPDLLE